MGGLGTAVVVVLIGGLPDAAIDVVIVVVDLNLEVAIGTIRGTRLMVLEVVLQLIGNGVVSTLAHVLVVGTCRVVDGIRKGEGGHGAVRQRNIHVPCELVVTAGDGVGLVLLDHVRGAVLYGHADFASCRVPVVPMPLLRGVFHRRVALGRVGIEVDVEDLVLVVVGHVAKGVVNHTTIASNLLNV